MEINKDKLIKEWEDLSMRTEQEQEVALEFYKQKIMPLSIDAYLKNSKDKKKEGYSHMILSVGTSYEPLVLSLLLWKPEKVLFLYTKETEAQLDLIFEFIDLKPSQYDKEIVDSTRILSIYQKIKKKYLEWGKPEKLIVDPTGGTKAMTAATAMAGYILNATLVYVAGANYSKTHRRPVPGTEHLEYIDNPLKEFGDLEKEKADDYFDKYNYYQAREIYMSLKELVHGQKEQYKSMHLLSSVYDEWDNLQFDQANITAQQLLIYMNDYERYEGKPLYKDATEKIRYQMATIKEMQETQKKTINGSLSEVSNNTNWIFMLYLSAQRRAGQGKYDMAVLLLYRTLELVMKIRLLSYGMNDRNADYKKLPKDKTLQQYQASFSRHWADIHKIQKVSLKELPSEITMMSGYILLAVLKDTIIDKNTKGFLTELYSKNQLRNNNIFAHGFDSISSKDYDKYASFVNGIIERYCQTVNINKINTMEQLTFVCTNELL